MLLLLFLSSGPEIISQPGTCAITYAAANNVQFAIASLEIQYAVTTVDVQT